MRLFRSLLSGSWRIVDETMLSSSGLREFESTRWSLIGQAQTGSVQGREALQQLCESYWFPVYAFFRRGGNQAEDARDLTQELFTRMLSADGFTCASSEKGRFRSYLLAAAKNLAAERNRNRRTKKRGGNVKTWSIDWSCAEQRLQWEPQDTMTAERVFEIRWAKQILSDTMAQLDALNSNAERKAYYLRLRTFIAFDGESIPYAQASLELAVSESALRVQVHRLRRKFRQLLRQNVADTLCGTDTVDDELNYLLQCLQGEHR